MDRLIAPPSTLASSVPRPAVRTPRHASRATLVAGRRLGGRGRAARRGVHDGRTGYAPDGMCMYMAHLIPAPVAPRHLAVHPKTSNTHGRQTPGILLKLSQYCAPYSHPISIGAVLRKVMSRESVEMGRDGRKVALPGELGSLSSL